eukprot:scaffold321751_cov31-Tisochrysis_lutea.AAC.3
MQGTPLLRLVLGTDAVFNATRCAGVKEATLLRATAPGANQSTAKALTTNGKPVSYLIHSPSSCQWPTPGPIQTDHNSSSPRLDPSHT